MKNKQVSLNVRMKGSYSYIRKSNWNTSSLNLKHQRRNVRDELHWRTWKQMGGGGRRGSMRTTLDSTFGGGLKLFLPTCSTRARQSVYIVQYIFMFRNSYVSMSLCCEVDMEEDSTHQVQLEACALALVQANLHE